VAAGDFFRRVFREDKIQKYKMQTYYFKEAGGRGCLSSPPLCLSKILRLRQNFLALLASDPVQNTIHGFLDSGAGPMELPRGLGGELAKHITIPQCL
jgi:hypothetical protein